MLDFEIWYDNLTLDVEELPVGKATTSKSDYIQHDAKFHSRKKNFQNCIKGLAFSSNSQKYFLSRFLCRYSKRPAREFFSKPFNINSFFDDISPSALLPESLSPCCQSPRHKLRLRVDLQPIVKCLRNKRFIFGNISHSEVNEWELDQEEHAKGKWRMLPLLDILYFHVKTGHSLFRKWKKKVFRPNSPRKK